MIFSRKTFLCLINLVKKPKTAHYIQNAEKGYVYMFLLIIIFTFNNTLMKSLVISVLDCGIEEH